MTPPPDATPGAAPRPPARRPVVGVMGSGSEEHDERAAPLGRWLAALGVHLLTGGGGGVMAAVSRAFAATPGREGLVLGVLPADPADPARARAGYPNPWVEVAVRTHLPLSGREGDRPLSRNHVNVLSSDVIVVLPGGAGTASEAALALRYGRPIVAWLATRGELPGLPDGVEVVAAFADLQARVAARLPRRPGG